MNPEVKLLPPSKQYLVDSDSLPQYLFYHNDLEDPIKMRFARELALPWCTDFMERLYQTSEPAKLFSHAIQSHYHDASDFMARHGKTTEADDLRQVADVQIPGERSATVFYDETAGELGLTEVRFGEAFKGTYELVINSDDGPVRHRLFVMHTHPFDSLPSTIDYQPVLFGDPEIGHRFAPGIIVLCPDMQILALATGETPILSPDVVTQYVRSFELNDISDKDATYQSYEQVAQAAASIQQVHEDAIRRSAERYALMTNRVNSGRLDAKTAARILKRRLQREQARAEREGTALTDKAGKHLANAHTTENRYINSLNIAFARSIGVKLYVSSDMENFDEFSA